MKKRAAIIILLLLLVCQEAIGSDAAKSMLPSGMYNPMTLRYPELANAPAPALIKEGLRATYEIYTGSGREETGGDLTYVSKDSPRAGLVQVDIVALEGGKAATWTNALSHDPTNGAFKPVNFYGSVSPRAAEISGAIPRSSVAFQRQLARI